jgi:uncharacterized protein (DUF1810 family)
MPFRRPFPPRKSRDCGQRVTHDQRSDGFDLNRFVDAQHGIYDRALEEIRSGHKRSHWMWYVFPQITGLGSSPTSQFYAITSIDEARAYLQHPVLVARLIECAEAVLAINGKSATEIFGYPDDMKLRSSMTLFAQASPPSSIYERVLGKYFAGEHDPETIRLLKSSEITEP